MTDLELMIELQRQNRAELGFIPDSTLRDRYCRSGQYLISTHRTGGKIGFLIFGRPLQGHVLHIHQTCLELDHRRRQHASDLVQRLHAIATAAGCSEIRLRCRTDINANAFWKALGAEHFKTTPPKSLNSHALNHYVIALDTDPKPLLRNLWKPTTLKFVSDFSRHPSDSEEPSIGSCLSPVASVATILN